MRKWYAALLMFMSPLILTGLSIKMRRYPNKLMRLQNWLGFSSTTTKTDGIWIHAASVGEVRAALPIVQALRQTSPDIPITLTTQSPTGQATVQSLLGSQVISQYCPLDLPGAGKRFLKRNQPRLAIFLETEIWPNLLHELKTKKIPVLLANGRLSQKSVKAYRQWHPLFNPALTSFAHIFAQTEQDALHFLGLGIDRRLLSISGNLKYDCPVDNNLLQEGLELRKKIGKKRPVWIAASTHAYEEDTIFNTFTILKQQLPELFLIVVPRHPERFEPVAKHLQQLTYSSSRFSERRNDLRKIDILLCDVMGKLVMLYHASDVAFIGGSLTQGQGHNPLEAASAACAIVTGHYVSSFAEICENLAKQKALVQVKDIIELTNVTLNLLQQPDQRNQMILAAQKCADLHKGALEKHMAYIQNWL